MKMLIGMLYKNLYSSSKLEIVIFIDSEKMSKRKHECIENELNEIVTEWLMKVKCEKSLKLFQSQKAENSNANSNNVLDKVRKFREFLMTKTVEVHKDDDLGFEINFGLQNEPNVQVSYRRILIEFEKSVMIIVIFRSAI